MEGQELVEKVSQLGPREILGYEAAARAGDPQAVAVVLARGAYKLALKRGLTHAEAKAELGAVLDSIEVKVEVTHGR